MPLACGTRNSGKYGVCFIMFEIASFSFILLLINDWRLVMQVNIHQSFFCQSFAAAFSPNFFTAKVFYCMVCINSEICMYIIQKIQIQYLRKLHLKERAIDRRAFIRMMEG